MCLSLVLVVMTVSGLNTALPTIQSDLGASASELQWIVDAYAMVFAGLLLSAGAIGDRFGRRRALLGGLTVFGVGTLVGGLATSSTQLIAGRAVMGVGAAFIMPATLSIITAIFPPNERTRAIAVWAGFAGAGASIGPVVTGGLLEGFWWGSTILVNVPLVIGIIAAVVVFAPDSRDDTKTPLDPVGAVLSLVGVSSLIFAIIQGPEDGWTSGRVLPAFLIAGVALAAFVAWERRSDHPILPMTLFRDRRFSTGTGVVTIVFFVMFGFFFLVTQYFQFGRGYSPLEAGLATLPAAFTTIAVSPRSAALAQRFGAPRVMAAGLAVVAGGLGVLSRLSPDTPYPVIAAALALLGAGVAIAAAPATGEIMTSVPLSKAGVGSAVNDTTRELGGALGIALLGSIANTAYRSGIDLSGVRSPPTHVRPPRSRSAPPTRSRAASRAATRWRPRRPRRSPTRSSSSTRSRSVSPLPPPPRSSSSGAPAGASDRRHRAGGRRGGRQAGTRSGTAVPMTDAMADVERPAYGSG